MSTGRAGAGVEGCYDEEFKCMKAAEEDIKTLISFLPKCQN